jgi:hypothetical protein
MAYRSGLVQDEQKLVEAQAHSARANVSGPLEPEKCYSGMSLVASNAIGMAKTDVILRVFGRLG